jgi:UDP-2-acetamido-2-deoxy-ribo-hexuluronate aminotransferase
MDSREKKIHMADLYGQYLKIKNEIDAAVQDVINSTAFIQGKQVGTFSSNLRNYTGAGYVIPCANGTDALQISLMALGLQPGDEVIVPAFTYVAAAEVIGLLQLVPVLVDVDYHTFNMEASSIGKAVSGKTRAIIPVHLFGQSCNMEEIMAEAGRLGLFVVEDNAQAIGARYTFSDGKVQQAGTIGLIGCTSFFPSKNLGCFGDGGAMFTHSDQLGPLLKMIASHGQETKYYHKVIGCNSRLDTLQAAILDVKLKYLNDYAAHRYKAAQHYTKGLSSVEGVITPEEVPYSTHVYHQYTLKVLNGKREALKNHLVQNGIPSMIYYPRTMAEQEAFAPIIRLGEPLDNANRLVKEVLSLPIDTEIDTGTQDYIIGKIKEFYNYH